MNGRPDLRGWETSSGLAARLGVCPSTIRRRAVLGLLEAIPNPVGPGSLYHEKDPLNPLARPDGKIRRPTAANSSSDELPRVRADDARLLRLLPGSAPSIASDAGEPRSTVAGRLRRLERAGLVTSSTGLPRSCGGRPPILWSPSGDPRWVPIEG